jgi:ribokinase
MPLSDPRQIMEKFAKPKVVVVGGYNADLVVSCANLPVEGESIIGGPLQIYGGGRGANCAVAAARAGAAVTFVGAHGHDAFGGMAQGQLSHEGIDISHFSELPDVSTGASLSMMEISTGRNFLVCAESANNHLTPEMVRSARKLLHSADLVISELEIPPETAWEAMKICEERNIPFLVDVSPVNRISHVPKNNILAIIGDSLEEVLTITGTSAVPEAIAALHSTGARNVVLVDHRREIIYSDRQTLGTLAVPIERPIDRCGATECLETWIGLALIRNVPLSEACREASFAMAHSLSHMGGHHGMPYPSEVSLAHP